jgi:hypothetical protein
MNANGPDSVKPGPEGPAATDEDLLRLRTRLDRELAVVTQKLSDAEDAILDIELSLRAYESGTRLRLPGTAGQSGDKGSEKITRTFRSVGDKIKDWIGKPKEGEGAEAPAPRPAPAEPRPAGSGDLDDRLESALRSIGLEIRDREKEATELDRKLHESHKELIRLRANEQHAREMQIQIGQTKQLSEDLERKMNLLNEMVGKFETSMKTDTGMRVKPKEAGPVAPKLEDRLQTAIDDALKAVAAQEKKTTEVEKELARANAALVEERGRQQRVRAMQIRLRQARHFSSDLQRALGGLGASLDDLRHRAGNLLRPEARTAREAAKPRPAEAATQAPAASKTSNP